MALTVLGDDGDAFKNAWRVLRSPTALALLVGFVGTPLDPLSLNPIRLQTCGCVSTVRKAESLCRRVHRHGSLLDDLLERFGPLTCVAVRIGPEIFSV